MKLYNEILETFHLMSSKKVVLICNINQDYPSWIIKDHGFYGVLFEYMGDEFNADFSNVTIRSTILNINGSSSRAYLMLMSDDRYTLAEFASICTDFLEVGYNGEKRLEISHNPKIWWDKWKSLIGNSDYEKRTYSILAELLVYYSLIKNGEQVIWSGLDNSTHDIQGKSCDYEVKSTIRRYDYIVTINGQFQLTKENPLKMIFVRMEKSENGYSIKNILEELYKFQNIDYIETSLSKHGIKKGSPWFNETYKVLECLEIFVDDSFPCITASCFKNNLLPEGIVSIEYKVNLEFLKKHAIIL